MGKGSLRSKPQYGGCGSKRQALGISFKRLIENKKTIKIPHDESNFHRLFSEKENHTT
jgi:hypothetical protein